MDTYNLHFIFQKNIIKNIKDLYFKVDTEIDYINSSHANYKYEIDMNDREYIFYGFYKDGYFIILIDIYDKLLKVSIADKKVIIIKMKWNKKNIENKINLFFVDIQKRNYEYIELSNRKELLDTIDLSIDELLVINHYNKGTCIIDNIHKNNIDNNNENSISSNYKIINKIGNKLSKWFL